MNPPQQNNSDSLSVKFTRILVWPAGLYLFLLVFILVFRAPIDHFIDRTNEASANISAKGVSITAQAAAESAGQTAYAQGVLSVQTSSLTPQQAQTASEVGSNLGQGFAIDNSSKGASAIGGQTGLQGTVLWVDESTQNNVALSNSFQQLGIKVVEVTTSDEALSLIKLEPKIFDVIITSMTRDGNHEAGVQFVNALHQASISTPVIIYAAHWAPEHFGQEEDYGVQAITNDYSVVYKTVIRDIRS